MGTLLEKALYALESKNLLKTALNAKGASVQANTTFREYPEKVNNLVTADAITHPTFEADTSTGGYKVTAVLFDLRVPNNYDGQTVTTAEIPSALLARLRSIYAPAEVVNVKITNGSTDIEEIQLVGCTSLTTFTLSAYYSNLKRVILPAITTFTINNWNYVQEELTLPAVTTLTSGQGSMELPATMKIDLRSLPLVKSTAQQIAKEWTADDRFDALAEINGVFFVGATGSLYLPSLQIAKGTTNSLGTYTDTAVFTPAEGGALNLYIGANLSELGDLAIADLQLDNVVVHIPEGDTTTKATLDTAGVVYVQDYAV
jgi:hypothetical protein